MDDPYADAVAKSISSEDNVEHIFKSIGPGSYEIVVNQTQGGDRDFGLAWWFGDGPSGPIQGDFDSDQDVDDMDLTKWKMEFGTGSGADANGDGVSDGADFLAWQRNYGFGVPATPTSVAVPEPAACLLALIGLPMLLRRR